MRYLYSISKQEFSSLYNFGELPAHTSRLINFEVSKSDIEHNISEGLEKLPSLNGDEDYFFVELSAAPIEVVEIENVESLIPFTTIAGKSLEQKFGSNLNFTTAEFENIVLKHFQKASLSERFSGGVAFLKILYPELNAQNKPIPDNIIEKGFEKRLDGIKSDKFKSDFYEHLFVYDRYANFPNLKYGFLYDIGEMLANMKGGVVKNTGYYQFLEENKEKYRNKKLSELFSFFDNAIETKKLRDTLTHDGVKLYAVGLLYLELKEYFNVNNSVDIDYLYNFKEYAEKQGFEQELINAVYLVGCFYGYGKFKDELYSTSHYKVLREEHWYKTKKKKEYEKPSEVSQEKSVEDSSEDNSQDLQVKLLEVFNEISNNGKLTITGKNKRAFVSVIEAYDETMLNGCKTIGSLIEKLVELTNGTLKILNKKGNRISSNMGNEQEEVKTVDYRNNQPELF